MSERANIAAKRLGKKSASTLHDPKAAAAQAIVHLDDDLHKVGKDTQTAAARLQAQFRGHHARAMSRLLSWEMEKVTKLVVDTMRGLYFSSLKPMVARDPMLAAQEAGVQIQLEI